MVLDQFLPRNRMVPSLGAHSHIIALFGNQTYTHVTTCGFAWFRSLHSYRGTFITTTGVNVIESIRDLFKRTGSMLEFDIHEALQRSG